MFTICGPEPNLLSTATATHSFPAMAKMEPPFIVVGSCCCCAWTKALLLLVAQIRIVISTIIPRLSIFRIDDMIDSFLRREFCPKGNVVLRKLLTNTDNDNFRCDEKYTFNCYSWCCKRDEFACCSSVRLLMGAPCTEIKTKRRPHWDGFRCYRCYRHKLKYHRRDKEKVNSIVRYQKAKEEDTIGLKMEQEIHWKIPRKQCLSCCQTIFHWIYELIKVSRDMWSILWWHCALSTSCLLVWKKIQISVFHLSLATFVARPSLFAPLISSILTPPL